MKRGNSYSFSFEGAREIEIHPLQKNTAILVNNTTQQKAFGTAIEIKKALSSSYYHHKVFHEIKAALEWLQGLENDSHVQTTLE